MFVHCWILVERSYKTLHSHYIALQNISPPDGKKEDIFLSYNKKFPHPSIPSVETVQLHYSSPQNIHAILNPISVKYFSLFSNIPYLFPSPYPILQPRQNFTRKKTNHIKISLHLACTKLFPAHTTACIYKIQPQAIPTPVRFLLHGHATVAACTQN